MLGLGVSLLKGGVKALTYVKDSLKLFFNFKSTDRSFHLAGSTTFDGDNDYISVADSSDWDTGGAITIGFWFKTDVEESNNVLIQHDASASKYSINIESSSDRLSWNLVTSSGTTAINDGASMNYENGEWHYCTCTYDRTLGSARAKIYIDGVLKGSGNGHDEDISAGDEGITIGSKSTGNYFNGKMANVGLWSRALSVAEIQGVMWKNYADLSTIDKSSLVSWWALQADANDSQGSHNGTNNGATINTSAYGGNSPFLPRVVDQADPKDAVQLSTGSTSFDGTDDYISIGDTNDLSFGDGSDDSAFSVSAWVNPVDASNFQIAFKDTEWQFYLNNSDKVALFLEDESSGAYEYSVDGGSAITQNVWTHVACTYNGVGGGSANAGIKLYVNGAEASSYSTGDSGSYVAMENSANAVTIGKQSTNFSQGKMANVGIWNKELSLSEIQSIMFAEQYAGLSDTSNLVSWYDLGTESSGSELITNGTMESNSGWGNSANAPASQGRSSEQAKAGTYSWKFVTDGSTSQGGIKNTTGFTTVTGKAYRLNYWIYNVGANSHNLKISDGAGSGSISGYSNKWMSSGQTNGQWNEITVDYIESSGGSSGYIEINGPSTSNTWYIDQVSIKQIYAEDSKGSNDGTITGATTTTSYNASPKGVADPVNYGKVYSGRAFNFDGTNDYVDCGNLGLSDTSGSITAWINISASATADGIIISGCDDSSSSNAMFFYYDEPGEQLAVVGNTGNKTKGGTTGLNDGKWHHVALVSNGSAYSIYLDGVAESLTVESGSNNGDWWGDISGIDLWTIGIHDKTTDPFKGKLSNIGIWNTVLTQTQIQELYTNPEMQLPTGVSASNLKGAWMLNEGAGSTAYDGSGNGNNGTITGATFVTGENAVAQTALVRANNPITFDGIDDWVDCGNDSSLRITGDLSLSAWVKTTSTGAEYIIARDNNSTRAFYLSKHSANQALQVRVDSGPADAFLRGSTAINDGEWHHVVAVVDIGSTLALYVDGVAETSFGAGDADISSITSLEGGAEEVYIGKLGNGSGFFDGTINEVGIWNTALDADAVSAIYNSGTPLDLNTNSGNYDNASNLVSYWRNNGTKTWTDLKGSNNGTVNGSPATYLLTEGITSGRDSAGFFLIDETAVADGVRLHGDSYVSIDHSPALLFGDGTGDFPFSVSCWLKIEDVTSKYFITKGSGTDREWLFGFDASDKLAVEMKDESAGVWTSRLADSANTSIQNTWAHVAFTYDGSGGSTAGNGITLYLNGSVLASTASNNGSYVAMEDQSANIEIGKYNTTYITGLIDEVKVYSDVLTADEVAKNYNHGKGKHS